MFKFIFIIALRFAFFTEAFHDVSHTFPYTTNVLKLGKDCSASSVTCKGKTDETWEPTYSYNSGSGEFVDGLATSTECGAIYTGLEPASVDCVNKLSLMKIGKPMRPSIQIFMVNSGFCFPGSATPNEMYKFEVRYPTTTHPTLDNYWYPHEYANSKLLFKVNCEWADTGVLRYYKPVCPIISAW